MPWHVVALHVFVHAAVHIGTHAVHMGCVVAAPCMLVYVPAGHVACAEHVSGTVVDADSLALNWPVVQFLPRVFRETPHQ